MTERGRFFTWRRWKIYAVLAALVALTGNCVGGPIWLDFKFDREVGRFGTPHGMRLVERQNVEGDFFCVITCLGKSTVLTLRSDTDAPSTCAALRSHLRARGYTLVEPPPLGAAVPENNPCFYWARATRIRKNATLTATVSPYEPTTAVIRIDANNG